MKGIARCLHGKGSMHVLVGGRGTGKTLMGCQLIRYFAYRVGVSCMYRKLFEFLLDVKGTFDSRDSEQRVISDFVAPQLLVLDEIQEKADNEWSRRLLTYMIDKRYDRMKHTVLIGNLETNDGDQAIIDCIGTSSYSRMIETGGIVVCDWDSFRGTRHER